jgi:hypothetical protein
MPFIMRRSTFDFFPAAQCDHCAGEIADTSGCYVAWPVDILAEPRDETIMVLCSELCLEHVSQFRAGEGEWIATPLAVYLANLIVTMDIDVDRVIETEQASVAAERTRDQAPD